MAAKTLNRPRCSPHLPIGQRLDHYTDKSGGPDACWLWTGYRCAQGYGAMKVDGASTLVHRLAWINRNGPIPVNKPHILHRCDNPPCVNPDHLWPGTIVDNNLDKDRKGRGGNRGGIHNGRAKLTENDVRTIRSMTGRTTKVEIAKRLGVCKTTVSNVTSGKCWKHVT